MKLTGIERRYFTLTIFYCSSRKFVNAYYLSFILHIPFQSGLGRVFERVSHLFAITDPIPNPYSWWTPRKSSFAVPHSLLQYLEYASEYAFVEFFLISNLGSLSMSSSNRVMGSLNPFKIIRSMKRQENLWSVFM